MIDTSKLKYYKILCEKGVIDESQNDLEGISGKLEERRLECLKRFEATKDEGRKDEINELLRIIDLQKKEIEDIKVAISSGIFIEKSEPDGESSRQDTLVRQDEKGKQRDKPIITESAADKKRKSIPIIVAVLCIAIVAVVFLLQNINSEKNSLSSDSTEVANESVNESNQSASEVNDDSNQANNQLSEVTVIKDGEYIVTCGELKEVLLQRFRTINPTITDFTEDNFEKSGYFAFGSQFNEAGQEEIVAILVKVLPPTGSNSDDDIIRSFSVYSTDELDLSKYYAEAIKIADPTIDIDSVQSLLSQKYNELKDIQPNDESIPIDFSIFDLNSLTVYFAVDRGAQWCVITDPSMDFVEMFNDVVNSF